MKKIPQKKQIIVYTDGSSLGNPGAGGGGVIFMTEKKAYEMSGYFADVTNNQMELEALKRAFSLMSDRQISGYKVDIFSDSKYCIDGLEKGIKNGKKNNGKTAAKKDVANKKYGVEISEMLDFLRTESKVNFHHVKAHNGEVYNERVDDLARWSAEQKKFQKYNGDLKSYLVK